MLNEFIHFLINYGVNENNIYSFKNDIKNALNLFIENKNNLIEKVTNKKRWVVVVSFDMEKYKIPSEFLSSDKVICNTFNVMYEFHKIQFSVLSETRKDVIDWINSFIESVNMITFI